MANLVTLGFNAGPDGGPVNSTTQPGIDSNTSAFVTFTTDAYEGAFAARYLISGVADSVSTPVPFTASTTMWWSAYYKFVTMPSAVTGIGLFYGTGNTVKVGDLRVHPDGSIQARDVNTSRVLSGTGVVVPGEWFRASVRCTPGSGTGLELKVYTGANINSTTPTFSGTGAATNSAATSVDTFRMGVGSAATVDYRTDYARVDDASEPAALVAAQTLTFQSVSAVGWAVTGGASAQAVLADASDATYIDSPNNPTNSLFELTLQPNETIVGDLVVTLRGLSLASSSQSITATLKDGGTTVATATVTPITGTLGDFTLTFPAASISSVTQAKWRSGTLVVAGLATAA